jgi:tetratricopeptide (TPR) repeat protein
MNNLAYKYQALGRFDDARRLLDEALQLGARVLGTQSPRYGIFLHTRGEVELAAGNYSAAEPHLRRAMELYRLQPGHEFLPLVLYQLAEATAMQHMPDQAVAFLSEALRLGYKHNGVADGFIQDEKLSSLRALPGFVALTSKSNAAAQTDGASSASVPSSQR